MPINHKYNHKEPFIPQVGLTFVRGCEIEGMLDEEGKVIEEGNVITMLSLNLVRLVLRGFKAFEVLGLSSLL